MEQMLVKTPQGRRTLSTCSSGKRLPEQVVVPSPSSTSGAPRFLFMERKLGAGKRKD